MKIPASEWKRKAVHAGMGLFALALRFLTWEQAALCALAALLFNLFVLPRIGRGIYRDSSKKRDVGIVAYPAMVLALILLFRRELDVVAVVWAMMAFGDPAASIAGRLVEGPALPWNPGKTWIGMLTNWAVSTVSSLLVLWFYIGAPPAPGVVAILLAGAALFAFLESMRTGLDDNIVAPIPTALAIMSLSGMDLLVLALPGPRAGAVLLAAGVNLGVAFLTWRLRLVSRSGAVNGAILGFLVVAFGGWRHYGLLWTFFLLGTAATKLGYRKKKDAGLAESNEGRRGASNVWANGGVPLGFLMFAAPPIAFPAAFAAALSDTLGTEVGTLYGRRAFSPLTLRRLEAGTPGAVSLAGTLASLAGAVLMALAAWALKLTPPGIAWLVVAGGFLGSLAESVLNDLGRRLGFALDHDFANALNTFVGGLAAVLLGLAAAPVVR